MCQILIRRSSQESGGSTAGQVSAVTGGSGARRQPASPYLQIVLGAIRRAQQEAYQAPWEVFRARCKPAVCANGNEGG